MFPQPFTIQIPDKTLVHRAKGAGSACRGRTGSLGLLDQTRQNAVWTIPDRNSRRTAEMRWLRQPLESESHLARLDRAIPKSGLP